MSTLDGLVLLAIGWCALGAGAARAADRDPGWELHVAPYVWATPFDGTVDAHDAEAELDFSDVLDAMDAAFLLALEARKERVSLTLNGIYLRLATRPSARSRRCSRSCPRARSRWA